MATRTASAPLPGVFFGNLLSLLLGCASAAPRLAAPSVLPGAVRLPNGIGARADFSGARLTEITAVDDSTVLATIAPENTPVNNSAWYGFKLWSPTPRTVRIQFAYRGGSHRYAPKLRTADGPWQSAEVVPNAPTPMYRVRVGRDTTLIFAQVPVTTTDIHAWIDRVTVRPEVTRRIIGQSVRGRPIHALEIGSPSAAANYVFVIGRQHPPEITGSLALMPFVDEISGPTKLAADFRRRFRVVVVPLLNPDGVESGNWRHNANGVDLNRDWEFAQPETRAARDEFLRLAPAGSAEAHFAVDFHSTRETVAYTMLDRLVKRHPALMAKWLGSIHATHPEFSFDAAPSDDTNPVSKNWFNRTYGIPSLTFEVGDDVDPALVRMAGARAAQSLMELLLAEP